jgi:hypothetical protein
MLGRRHVKQWRQAPAQCLNTVYQMQLPMQMHLGSSYDLHQDSCKTPMRPSISPSRCGECTSMYLMSWQK